MAGVVPYPTVTGAETAHGAQTSAGGNPWLPYFGPSSGPLMTNAYDKYAEQNYDLPEAYKGRNLYLRDTINGLITGEGRNDFYTVALLPWAQTDQITFSWNEFHFNETLAGRVPHEGVSRLVTSSKRTKSDKAVRRGLAMVLEHGFMSTEEGQEMYRRNLIGIAQSIQETANHDVMAAIFSCDSYDQRWERDHGIVTDGLRRLMHEEVYRFAAVQKEANGLDILVEDAKKRMGRYGVAPDTLVIPPKLSIYMSLVRPEKSQYYIGGPPAMENVKRGGAISDFRNLSVYETRSFDVYKGEPPVDISLRRRQVGEYYTVGPNAGIVVYDEAMDNWRRLGHHELVNNCGRWFGADTPKDPKILAVYRKLMQSFEDSGYEQSVDVRIDDLKTADWAQIRASKWKHNNRSRGPPDTQWTKATGEEFYSFVRSSGSIAGLGVDSAVRDQIHDRVSALVSTGDNSVSLHDISADCKQLFDLERQSAEFKSVFAGMGTAAAGDGTNRAIVANEDGYTGHAAMHQSYRGVQLIAQYGDAAQVTAARRVLRSVDHVHKLLTVGQDMAAWVPANYLHTCDGLSMAALTSEHVAKTWVFAELSQCGFGHSLVPVTVDGRVDSAFANMEGGTVVCPGFAVAQYASVRSGAIAGLALTNVGLGVVGNRTPASVAGVTDGRWDLGFGNVGASYADTHETATAIAAPRAGETRRRDDRSVASADDARPSKRAQPDAGAGSNSLLDMLISSAEPRASDPRPQPQPQPQPQARPRAAQRRGQHVSTGHTNHLAIATDKRHSVVETMHNVNAIMRSTSSKAKRDPLYRMAVTSLLSTTIPSSHSVGGGAYDEVYKKIAAEGDGEGYHPYSFLILRPFIEHQMHTILCMKGGAETGNTYYGHNSVTVGDDAVSKMHYVNLTFYSKAVVKESKNIIRLEDVYASGYIGGNDCTWFKDPSQVRGYDASKPGAPSLFVSIARKDELLTMPNPISITGVFSAAMDRNGADARQHYTGAAFMNARWGFSDVAQYDTKTRTIEQDYMMSTRPVNSVCFQGAQFTQSKVETHDAAGTGEQGGGNAPFDRAVPNSGHWGATYPGVKAVREGQHKYMRSTVDALAPSMPVSAAILGV
jgi:hypothetical protein